MEREFNLEELPQIVEKVFKKINEVSSGKATVLTLSGELGAGKTRFTQEFGKMLGIKEKIISPTFVIMKIYKINSRAKTRFKKLVHIDAYRLDSSNELKTLDWTDLIEDKNNLIIVEWPERVKKCLENIPIYSIELEHIDDNKRNFKFLV